MSWSYIEYEFPIPYLFHKELVWLNANCAIYFAFKLNSTDDWHFFSGTATHALNTGNILVDCSTVEATAQTNYLVTTKDTNGKVVAILPSNIQAKYARVYIQSGANVTIHEWRPSTYFTAHEIISGELTLTDELSDAPLIKVTSGGVDRLKIGNIYESTYGIIGYSDTSATIFELSASRQQIAGFNFDDSTITATYLKIESGDNAQILLGDDVTSSVTANIALLNSGTARFKDVYLTTHTVIRDLTGSSDLNGTYIAANTITANKILVDNLSALSADLGEINAGQITGVTITGGTFQTSTGSKKIIITNDGITLQSTTEIGNYSDFLYGDGTVYGSGARAYIHHTNASVPFYISAEASVGDFHYFNRSADPTGYGEVGDTIVSDGKFKLSVTATRPAVYRTVGPVKYAFNITATAMSNIATNSWVTLQFNNERYDLNSNFNTADYTFTAPVNGYYHFDLSVLLQNIDSAAYYGLGLVTSNKTYYNYFDPRTRTGDIVNQSMQLSIDVDMDENDTAIAKVFQSTGTAQTDVSSTQSYFTGHWFADYTS